MAEGITIAESEIPDGEAKIITVRGIEIGVFRVGGEYYAHSNLCPHQGGPPCTGYVTGTLISDESTNWQPRWIKDGEILCCPWHGFEFDIPSGKCLTKPELRLRSYAVKQKDGMVTVEV